MKGHKNVVTLLLGIGKVDVNLRDRSGLMPLYYVAAMGHRNIIQLLLATGKVDVNATRKNLRPAITAAR